MEFLFFMFFLFIVFSMFKTEKKGASADRESYSPVTPTDWAESVRTRTAPQDSDGMQDDFDGREFFEVSKAKLDRAQNIARTAAASKLSYDGLPQVKRSSAKAQIKRVEAKRVKTNRAKRSKSYSSAKDQIPLMQDMNMQRRYFLSGGRKNTAGKTVLAFVSLMLILFGAVYMLNGGFT